MKSTPLSVQVVRGPAAILALALFGCGGRTGDVSGTVRFNGKPLPTGYVTFLSESAPGVRVSSLIRADGGYTVRDCPLGPVKITVKPVVPRGGREGMKPGSDSPPPVPGRYANPETSGLDCTIRSGRQQHDIELAP